MAFLKKKKTILGVVVLILILAIAFFFIKLDLAAQLRIGVGWKAQILCSGVFVSGRDAALVLKEDVAVHPILKFIGTKVNYKRRRSAPLSLGLSRIGPSIVIRSEAYCCPELRRRRPALGRSTFPSHSQPTLNPFPGRPATA